MEGEKRINRDGSANKIAEEYCFDSHQRVSIARPDNSQNARTKNIGITDAAVRVGRIEFSRVGKKSHAVFAAMLRHAQKTERPRNQLPIDTKGVHHLKVRNLRST